MLNYSVCIYIDTGVMRFLVGVQNSHRSSHRTSSVCPDHRRPPRRTPTVGLWSDRISSAPASFVGASRYL